MSADAHVSADNTHHSSLTFIVHLWGGLSENSDGSNTVCMSCVRSCIFSDVGLIKDLCVGGVGTGLRVEVCGSVLL